jgi:hypothetical protein
MSDPDPDPLKHFAEQQQSYEFFGRYRESLVASVPEFLRKNPGQLPVGVVIDGEAREAHALFRKFGAGTPDPNTVLAAILPRPVIVEGLRTGLPHALDLIYPNAEGKLPLVAITKNGVRFGIVDCEIE